MEETGFDFLKWGLVLAAWPIWAPFAKALWKEFQRAMRPEGGLTGPVPSKGQRQLIEEQVAQEELSQVHESLAHHKASLSAGARSGNQRSAGRAAGRATGGAPGGAKQQGAVRRGSNPTGGAAGRAVFRRRGQGSGGPQRPGFR